MDLQLPSRLDRLMQAVAEHHPLRAALRLSIHGEHVLVESSSPQLIAALRAAHPAVHDGETPRDVARVVLIEAATPDLGLSYRPWSRDPQHGGREQYVDIPGGRAVRDPHTGLTFLLGSDLTLAVGPCRRALPRVVELIHAAVIERLSVRGALACRGAGVLFDGVGILIAGPPKSGKTSLALSLAEEGAQLLGLERVLLAGAGPRPALMGLPDWSCLQPGSSFASPRLSRSLSVQQQTLLARLPPSDVWAMEEARALSPAELAALFERSPFALDATPALAGVVCLGWQPARFGACEVTRTTLEACPQLLGWLAKRTGPLCRIGSADARALTDLGPYLQRLSAVPVWSLRGGVDFARARALCRELAASVCC